MEYPKIPALDALSKIYNKIQNHNFKKALVLIEKYISIKDNGIYDMLLNLYIDCQIKLGLLDEANKNLNLMEQLFPNFYTNYELALKYANCCNLKKLEEILKTNEFKDAEYYMIGRYCFENTSYDLASKIFEFLIKTSTDEKIVNSSTERLRIINIYKNNTNIFPSQMYSCFKYHGNTLEPGHVVLVCKLREEYQENDCFEDSKILNRPYMIWKIVDKKIYAFPITTRKDKFRYTISKNNYPTRDSDRYLKDRVVCLNIDDVTTVIDKITEEDYNNAIESLCESLCHTQKGNWTKETEYFMITKLQESTIKIGSIIAVTNIEPTIPKQRYFITYDIDEENQQYLTYELNGNNYPQNNPPKTTIIDKEAPITAIYSLCNKQQEKDLLSIAPQNQPLPYQRLLKP